MNRLKELRTSNGLKQSDVAKAVNTSSMSVSRWESGESEIKMKKAQELADYFGVPIGYLLGLTDDANHYDDEKVFYAELKNGGEVSAVISKKRDYSDKLKKTKKQFIDFITENDFILSDFEIDTIFNLLSEMDLTNPNTKKHTLFFREFLHLSDDELEKRGYSIFANFFKESPSE